MTTPSTSSVSTSPPPTVPLNLSSLLELNLAYQDLVENLINELETILIENKLLHTEAHDILATQGRNCRSAGKAFRLPYFYDAEDRYPPPSEDVLLKERLAIRSIPVPKKWAQKELVALQECVYVSVKRTVTARLLLRKNALEVKLEKANGDFEMMTKLSAVEEEILLLEKLTKMELLAKYREERIDWLCISVSEFNGRRSDEELELMWRNYVWPNVEMPPWNDAVAQKLERSVEQSGGHPDWEKLANECEKHVYQCWELVMASSSAAKPFKITDESLLIMYNAWREKDYVPWVKIAHELNYTAPSRAIRRVEAALTDSYRPQWELEDDIHIILALYLYRGQMSLEKMSSVMSASGTMRTVRDCLGRLENLLGSTSIGSAIAHLEHYRTQRRIKLPKGRTKETMVPWLLSNLMALMDKIRMVCFVRSDPVKELHRTVMKISKNFMVLILCKRVTFGSDNLDLEIENILSPVEDPPKPVQISGIGTIHSVMIPVIEKSIFGMEAVTDVDRAVAFRGARARSASEKILKPGILPPCVSTVDAAQALLQQANDSPWLDPSIVEWIESQLETEPAFKQFEKHFNSMFALPMMLSRITVPEVSQLRETVALNASMKRKRQGITFRRKRGSKKPWIRARWDKLREEQQKTESQSDNENHENLTDQEEEEAGPSN